MSGPGHGSAPAWPEPRRRPVPTWPEGSQAEPPTDGHRAAPRRDLRIDVKLIVAVLIGVVSVTGAVVTWQASLLSESATDHDRLSIAETVEQQQLVAEAELLFANEKARAATFVTSNAAAERLELEAAEVEEDLAQSLLLQAATLRAQADTLTVTGAAPLSFLDYLDTTTGVLDERALRGDLQQALAGRRAADPERNAADARRLREDALELVRYLIPLALVILVLTVANISTRRRLRTGLLGVGALVWIAIVGLVVAS